MENLNCSKCGKLMRVRGIWLKHWTFGNRYVPAYSCQNRKCSEYKSETELDKADEEREKRYKEEYG